MRIGLSAVAGAMLLSDAAFAQSTAASAGWTAPTVALVAITAIALAALAIGVWRLSDRVAKCCERSGDAAIRGYLFPVAPVLYRQGGGGADILIKLGNFGRSPAILKESYLQRSAGEPAGDQASYQNGRLLKHDLVLDVNAQDVTLNAPGFPVDDTATSYIAGYFRYLDVFGASHVTRYCYRVQPVTGAIERAGSAAWNAFD
jgi:hypothetical protein